MIHSCIFSFTIFAVYFKMMQKVSGILIIVILSAVFVQCKKETDDWIFCNCTIDSWIGDYAGSGNYYKGEDVDAQQLEVQLTIEQIAPENLKVRITAPDYYNETFYGIKKDSTYYMTINGSNKSLIMNLKAKGDELKLTGTAKNFHWVYDPDSTYLVPDKTLAFDVLKTQP
jgi:hypothetical protein